MLWEERGGGQNHTAVPEVRLLNCGPQQLFPGKNHTAVAASELLFFKCSSTSLPKEQQLRTTGIHTSGTGHATGVIWDYVRLHVIFVAK